MQIHRRLLLPAALLPGLAFLLCSTLRSPADDWPRWRGANLDGISKETGWVSQWPAEGPKRLWEATVGVGFSSFSVSKGRLYTMGNAADKDMVLCFDAETGKPKWKHEYPCLARDPNGYHGTRCTPTVDGDQVYTLSRQGDFFCLDAATGRVTWSKDFKRDFKGRVPTWGFAGSPLIEKTWVLTEAGGPGAAVVAFLKASGEPVWKNGDDGAGYSSLIAFDLGGQRCFIEFSKDQVIGRRMKDGSEMWRQEWKTSYGVNAATPIIQGDELFVSSGYNYGCALFKMSPNGLEQVYRNKNMRNHVNSCVLVNGYIYGYDDNELKCLDWKSGEVKWSTGKYGKGALMCADGKLILYSQSGKLGVAEATPDRFKELASFQALPTPPGAKESWASPVLANGRIYVRNHDKIAAFDVKAQ